MNMLKRLAFAAGFSTMLLGGIGAAHAQDSKTFNIWWFEDPTSSEGIAWTKALNEFKAAHPDVTVNFQQKTFIQLQKAGSMILNSNQAPDLLEYNKVNATAGLVASQGLLTPLDDVVKAKGWDKILTPGDLTLSKYDDNGVYGSGSIYGISVYGEFVSAFYNKDMFKANGLSVPTTMDEFVADMDAFKKKGITPLALGGADTSGQHLLYTLALQKADDTWVQNYQGLKAPLDEAPYLYAAQTMVDWENKGYISKDSTGLICYVSSEPNSSLPKGVNRDPIHFLVVDRKGLGTRNEVQTLIGYTIKKGSKPSASVDGKTYPMIPDGSGAWLASAADEPGFVAAMKAGKSLVVTGTSTRGTETTDTYSLAGATAALDAANKACF